MSTAAAYPVRVEASLDQSLSRWLWLVKWILAVPHYFVLALLWLTFGVLGVVAFFAILVTGHYPRAIFDFNVGVLRWTWRVQYYAYAALGTDRYPPFTLADVPDYPARLEVDYPRRLSRGLVLVKWWLLAIPHYLIVGLFVGGGLWFTQRSDDFDWTAGGLVGVLVLVAGVLLLVTGSYPKPIYDFVLGMDRWVIRVGAYAALMTDEYPPFRLDMGDDPVGTTTGEPPVPAPTGHRRTSGRIASVIAGAVLALASIGLLTGGTTLLWADRVSRDAEGYLSAPNTFTTSGYATTSDRVDAAGTVSDWTVMSDLLGDVRARMTATAPTDSVFVGIAPSGAVARYLAGTDYATVRDFAHGTLTIHKGIQPATVPEAVDIWGAQADGTATQTVTWPRSGDWTTVVMNTDGSPGIRVSTELGAQMPALAGTGGLLLPGGVALIVVPIHRASHEATAVAGS